MLFRSKDGEIINIDRLNYLTDKEYINNLLKICYNKRIENIEENLDIGQICKKFLKENNIPNIDN